MASLPRSRISAELSRVFSLSCLWGRPSPSVGPSWLPCHCLAHRPPTPPKTTQSSRCWFHSVALGCQRCWAAIATVVFPPARWCPYCCPGHSMSPTTSFFANLSNSGIVFEIRENHCGYQICCLSEPETQSQVHHQGAAL